MRLTVKIWSSLSGLFGPEITRSRTLEVEVPTGATLLDLLRQLGDRYPAFGRVMFDPVSGEPGDEVAVVVNDRLPELLAGYATPLAEGDRVTLVQAYAGGSLEGR